MDAKRLKLERNLTDAQLGRVIERAAEMQRQAADDRANAIDVAAVAGEVDLEEKHVEAALLEMDRAREAELDREKQSAHRKKNLRRGAIGGAVVLGILLLAGAKNAAGRMQMAHAELQAAEARLQSALARQANLIPQLVAVSGGDPKPLLAEARKVMQADSPAARLEAADGFAMAISQTLAALPTQDSARALNMQHEVAGAQNRITTERARYEAALGRMRGAKAGAMAAVARGLGWGPEEGRGQD